MASRIRSVGWLVLIMGAVAGVAVAVALPGPVAGADRVASPCAGPPGLGGQHVRPNPHARPVRDTCTAAGNLPSGGSTPSGAPSTQSGRTSAVSGTVLSRLSSVPASRTMPTFGAGPRSASAAPARPSVSGGGSVSEQFRPAEVAAPSSTGVLRSSWLLVGALFAFLVAVAAVVVVAGRRSARGSASSGSLAATTQIDAIADIMSPGPTAPADHARGGRHGRARPRRGAHHRDRE
jgi:hypothetical protein